MYFTIKSRNHGEVEFSVPDGGGYAKVRFENSRDWQQICDGGKMLGSTIYISRQYEDQAERVCRNWWKNFLRIEREWN